MNTMSNCGQKLYRMMAVAIVNCPVRLPDPIRLSWISLSILMLFEILCLWHAHISFKLVRSLSITFVSLRCITIFSRFGLVFFVCMCWWWPSIPRVFPKPISRKRDEQQQQIRSQNNAKMNGLFVKWRQSTIHRCDVHLKYNKRASDTTPTKNMHHHINKHQWQHIINKIKVTQRVSNTFTILKI